MAAGLACHGTVGQSLAKVRKEVSGNNVDVLGLAGALNSSDSALQRISAAACRDQSIQIRICAHQSFCSLGTTLGRSACVLRLGKLRRIIRMSCVPLLNACLVAFPSAEPGRVALLPADQADVAVALVQKDLDQLLAVLRLVLVDSAHIVSGISCCLVDVCAGLGVDDAEELCKINAVVIAGLDGGSHFRIGGVADDDALASCRAELFDRSGNALGNMSLVNILDLDAQSLGCLVEDQLALRTENIGGAPDGHADLDVAVSGSLCLLLFCRGSRAARCCRSCGRRCASAAAGQDRSHNHGCTKQCTNPTFLHNFLL